MTDFQKADFDMGHGSERWVMYGKERKFVGRFKYGSPGASANHFVKFLIKNFTVEEYFGLLDSGMTPVKALETKGFISYNVAKAMKAGGYTTVREMLDAQLVARQQMMTICRDQVINSVIAKGV